MSFYTPEDFSPIYPASESPVHEGWYVASPSLEITQRIHQSTQWNYWTMWYWKNGTWYAMGAGKGRAVLQNRFWFGLRRPAK